MGKILREVIVSIYDILIGCRTLVRRQVCVGDDIVYYLSFAERVLDRYFYAMDHRDVPLEFEVAETFELSEDHAREICKYVESELLNRIQRTFAIIYPNRHYSYTVNTEQGFIRIVESEAVQPPAVEPNILLDDTDAWIPERLRR